MEKKRFYASGLNFTCKRCSSCCRYDAGFVFLSEIDLEKIVSLLKTNRESFIKAYCRWVTDWKGEEVLSLREKSNKDCILWDGGCTIYNARPFQCVSFPFWESIVSSAHSWEMAASGCPGINTGELHTKSSIDECIEKRINEPIIKGESEL
ncbi:MAG: YkgJ family cysteine cluster protein [Treponema sp.]|nr:YkgJ family cysteine cluster protein [Treponema sp.]MCL2236635.1 YkgJ family cysteine cluster protein [Treponema sp.]